MNESALPLPPPGERRQLWQWVLVVVVVGMSVFVGMAAALLRPLTDGFVPQSMFPLRHLVTSACKTAGSHALKKS